MLIEIREYQVEQEERLNGFVECILKVYPAKRQVLKNLRLEDVLTERNHQWEVVSISAEGFFAIRNKTRKISARINGMLFG